MMKLTRNAKYLLIVVAVAAVAAVGYIASGSNDVSACTASELCATEVAGGEASPCATCPYATSANREVASAETPEAATGAPSVDANRCIGCGKCVRVAPDAFKMNAETRKAEVKPGAPAASVAKGAAACPVDAVKQ